MIVFGIFCLVGSFVFYRILGEELRLGVNAIKSITALLVLVGCICTISPFFHMIKPGEVGIAVNLFGSERGVEPKEMNVGLYFVPPWKTVYRFPIFDQNHQWVNDDGFQFQTSEGLAVKADIGITFNLEQSKVHELFAKYRRGMEEITHLFIKNTIRDAINRAASKMKIEDLYGSQKEEFFVNVQQQVSKELEHIGFNISHIYIIGRFKVPDLVMAALDRKIEATQRAQQRENELREAEAQAKKDIAIVEGQSKSVLIKAKADAESLLIEARAKAEANTLLAKSLTPEIIKYQAIEKWDGKLPYAFTGDKSSFLLDLK